MQRDVGFAGQDLRSRSPSYAITVTPSPAEKPLRVALLVVGIALWIMIVVSVIGLVYGIMLGLFLFFAHLSLIAHIRGSSIKLGPDQMPEIYGRVVELSRRVGMAKVPDVYLRQSGGLLNAFATRFGRANFVVLFSELVYACGNNRDALDFIIAHELGHLHRGHLNLRWLIGPAFFIPFLGTAYSRACEYTCDRYGFQASDNPDLSLDGLCILAAGPQFAHAVNRSAFAAQDRDLNTAFMKLGEWFATHPPLALRLSALASHLTPTKIGSSLSANLGALAIALLIVVIPIGGGVFFIKSAINDVTKQINAASNSRNLPSSTPYSPPSYPSDRTRVGR